jgi:hypothetical protein
MIRISRFWTCALMVGWLVGSSIEFGARDREIRIFVTAATPVRDDRGFIEPIATKSLNDSAHDLRDGWTLRGLKIVQKREDAELVLTVTGRGMDDTIWGTTAIAVPLPNGGAVASAQPSVLHRYWVEAHLAIGTDDVHTFRTGWMHKLPSSSGAWSKCADQIGEELRMWVKANRDAIMARLVP